MGARDSLPIISCPVISNCARRIASAGSTATPFVAPWSLMCCARTMICWRCTSRARDAAACPAAHAPACCCALASLPWSMPVRSLSCSPWMAAICSFARCCAIGSAVRDASSASWNLADSNMLDFASMLARSARPYCCKNCPYIVLRCWSPARPLSIASFCALTSRSIILFALSRNVLLLVSPAP